MLHIKSRKKIYISEIDNKCIEGNMNELKQYISICCRWTFYIHTDQSIPYAWRAFISFFFLVALSLSWMALSIFLFQFLYYYHRITYYLLLEHIFLFFILFLLLKRLLLLFYSILTECEKIYWIPISRFLFFTFCFLSFDFKYISQELQRCVTFEVRRNLNCAYSAADCI